MEIVELIDMLEDHRDELIAAVARAQGLLPPIADASRARIRDTLRDTGSALRGGRSRFSGLELHAALAIRELAETLPGAERAIRDDATIERQRQAVSAASERIAGGKKI